MRRQEAVPMATQDSPNLYERLGGIYSIATVVDDLIDRVMADPRLHANPLVDDADGAPRLASAPPGIRWALAPKPSHQEHLERGAFKQEPGLSSALGCARRPR